MSKFIFGRKKIAYKDVHEKKQVTNIFLIDINKVVFSIRVCHAIMGKTSGTIMTMFIKTPKEILSYGVS